ncbi:MAG: FAD-dependent oxidoreductase [Planctomycetaceae bacterium]|nr:FAD-dependent oxidoreductase [Planctomycetaceae bacterium]
MKIAIIGSGISGLTAAYRLHRHHEITLFEADSRLGGHTNTVDVEMQGERHAIDTGFIVFNDWTYPNFIQLMKELGVASRPTTMGFSVHDETTGLEYSGESLSSLFAQRRNLASPKFYRMIADILRFHREAKRRAADCPEDMTVATFLARHHYSRQFADQYLLPMGAAIWSCPPGKFSQFPIRFLVEFFHNHGLLSVWNRPTWRVIEGGSQTYVRAITAGFRDRIRLATPVRTVRRFGSHVELSINQEVPLVFDHVIFACHSDQAVRLLGEDATSLEQSVLSAFPYQRNVAVLHTDATLLPNRRKAWASWNYRISHRYGAESAATVTYNMNILQGLQSAHTFCVTLNDEARIAPDTVLGRYEYHHPVFTVARSEAQRRHPELLAANRTSFCGAYWGNGFHEDGVNSALAVEEAVRRLTNRIAVLRRPGTVNGKHFGAFA